MKNLNDQYSGLLLNYIVLYIYLLLFYVFDNLYILFNAIILEIPINWDIIVKHASGIVNINGIELNWIDHSTNIFEINKFWFMRCKSFYSFCIFL